jgi:hypothetical protein
MKKAKDENIISKSNDFLLSTTTARLMYTIRHKAIESQRRNDNKK